VKADLTILCEKLDYQFKDLDLLRMALTHRSAGVQNNERLEFLGDSIVNFLIAEAVYQQSQNNGPEALLLQNSVL